MKDHILEFTRSGSRLTKRRGHLIVEIDEQRTEIPLDDIFGVLILSEDIWISTNVLSGLLERGIAVQFCDSRYMPSGLLLPFVGHSLTRSRQLAQIKLSKPQVGRLWQKIIVQKISNQANVLSILKLNDVHVKKFICEVEIHDVGNHEAQAARVYWQNLFGRDFRRNSKDGGLNSFLNYGYAVLRSSISRYSVACGLNPALGLFHKNMENPFCLVDDLMEPFRPIVDRHCFFLQEEKELNPSIKKGLVAILEHFVEYRGEKKTLRSAMQEYCQSFARSVLGGDWRLFDVDIRIF